MAFEIAALGLGAGALNGWAIWILPFAASLIVPGVAKFSSRGTTAVAVAFALMSAISATTLLPSALE